MENGPSLPVKRLFGYRLPRSRAGVALIRCYKMGTQPNPSPGPSPPSRDNCWEEKGRGRGILIESSNGSWKPGATPARDRGSL